MLDRTGPIYFEFTEVEGGGTVVKATYNSNIKARVTRFKAKQPLRIPAVPIGGRCPACGMATLPEFKLCPYCGEAQAEHPLSIKTKLWFTRNNGYRSRAIDEVF